MSGGTEPVVPPVEPAVPVVTEPELPADSLAGDFLKNIPDSDKAVVEKYIKDWDAGVTKKFQGIHEQYAPYKELGELTDVQAAIQLRQLLDNDPEYVYNTLAAEFGQKPPTGTPATPDIPKELEGLPPEFRDKWLEQQTMLENLAQLVVANTTNTKEAEEDAALASYMDGLKKQHGEFDEDFVLAKMWHGASGDDAVKAYQDLVQNVTNSQSRPKAQPPGLFGGGAVPADTPDVSTMEGKDVRNLVASLLSKK